MEQKFKFNLQGVSAWAKRKLKRLNSKKKVNLTQNKMNYNS